MTIRKQLRGDSYGYGRGDTQTDILIVGGGVGGCAAAMAATSLGKKVILTEETDWVGGQLTSQAVPPDEHSWIEQFGRTQRYANYRYLVRKYYRDNYALTPKARRNPFLNPGNGFVSRICHEFRVGVAVLDQMFAPTRTNGLLEIRLGRRPVGTETEGDRIRAVTFEDLTSGSKETVEAPYVIDATELGDLLPLAGVEYVTGFESQQETGELHAPSGSSQPDNVQALTWVFAVGYDRHSNRVIDKPQQYQRWANFVPPTNPPWPFPLFSWDRPVRSGTSSFGPYESLATELEVEKRYLFAQESDTKEQAWFNWRRIIYPGHFEAGTVPHEVAVVIWTQNDYMSGNIIDRPETEVKTYLEEARQQSLSFLYWMQTAAPRPDGGAGYPGLYLVPEVTGTEDGLAKSPYIRESRRIKSVFTVTENHIGAQARGNHLAEPFNDTVGVGLYHIDLHFSTGGDHGIHLECLPFQIPLSSLVPVRIENLLPASKNLGVTHLTSGSFRLHPVEWNVGEASGLLAAFCLERNLPAKALLEDKRLLQDFQTLCLAQGFELEWPKMIAESGWAAFDKRSLGYLPSGAIPRGDTQRLS